MSQLPASGPDTVYVWISHAADDRPATTRRVLLRAGTALLGRPAGELLVGRSAEGQPWVRVADGAGELPVSVSHTGPVLVVAARPGGPVGVDVERRRPLPAVALARRWFDPAEADRLRGLPEAARAEGFLLLWTAKEAVGKATGRGLRAGGLRRVVPEPAGWPPRPLPDDRCSWVGHPAVGDDLVLAVAGTGPERAGPVRVVVAGRNTGHGAAARSASTDRTSLPVAVRGS